jgi:hypothetical protein
MLDRDVVERHVASAPRADWLLASPFRDLVLRHVL